MKVCCIYDDELKVGGVPFFSETLKTACDSVRKSLVTSKELIGSGLLEHQYVRQLGTYDPDSCRLEPLEKPVDVVRVSELVPGGVQ